jgi:fucose permease
LPFHRGTALAVGSFLTFGALLVLYGANGTELIAHLELDYADLGLLGSMLSLGLGVGIVVAGPLTDRLPRRPLYFASSLLVIAATTTLGPGTDYQTLLVHTIAIGFGAGFYETVLNALIVEEFAERAPRRLIFIHSAATLAASATPLLFELLRGVTPVPWYDTFRIVGAAHVGLLLAVAFVPMPSRSPRNEATSPESATGAAGASERVTRSLSEDDRLALAAVCVATFAYVGVESALTLFVADHATSDLGLEAARAARTISAFWGGLLIGRLAVGLSPRSPGAGSIAGLAVIAAIIVLAFGLGWIDTPEIATALVGFFLGGVFPVMIGLAGIALPSSAGTAVGLAGGLGSLGGFAIPWFTGRLATQGGLSIGIASLSAWLALLVAAAAFVRSRHTKSRMHNLRQQG